MIIYKIAEIGCYLFTILVLIAGISTFDYTVIINSLIIGVFFYFILKRWKKKIIEEEKINKTKPKE